MSTQSKKWPAVVKITHGKGRCVINIPTRLARETGLDQAEYALIRQTGKRKLEVREFHGPEDYKG